MRFRDRSDAGRQLASRLLPLRGKDVVVLGLPRGGVAVAAEAAGRPAPRVVCILPVCVTSDPGNARERAGRVFAIYGELPSYRAMLDREGASGPADVAIVGDEDSVGAQIGALADAGVTDFVAGEYTTGEDGDRTRAFLRTLLTGAGQS